MTIYAEKINEFISQLESEIKQLEIKKKAYEKVLNDLKELRSIDKW